MNWNDIWRIVLAIISSVGGVGVVIIFIVKFCSNIIADKLSQKYKLTMNKELEKYKAGIDNKTYMSKAKFDAEFDLYRKLSKAFFDMIKNISNMIPTGIAKRPIDPQECEKYENGIYKDALNSAIVAQDVLKSNIPFVPESIYQKYTDILDLCKIQLDVFEERWNVLYLASPEEKKRFETEDYRRTIEINKKFEELNDVLREYLAQIDVIE